MSAWRETLDDLVRARGRALYGYAVILTGDSAAAEDLLQDALVRAFRSGRRARDLDAAHLYVKRAIASASIDNARRRAARPAIATEHDVLAQWHRAHPVAPDHAGRVGDALDLRSALATLSPRERACVVLRYLEDMSVADVAETLGLSDGSVKRYSSDGLNRLRAALPHLHFGEAASVRVTDHERGRP